MNRKVIYTGNTRTRLECSSPQNLVKGKEYTVKCQSLEGSGVVVLKEVPGYFDQEWFVSSKTVSYLSLDDPSVTVIGRDTFYIERADEILVFSL